MKKHIHDVISENELRFDKILEPLIEHIEKTWDINVKPKGWDEFLADYEDYDGLPVEDSVTDMFNGLNDGSAGAGSFPERVSLPHVAYGNTNQGRSPLEELLGATLGYGMMIGMKRMGLKNEEGIEKIKRDLKHHTHDIHETTFAVWFNNYLDTQRVYGETKQDL